LSCHAATNLHDLGVDDKTIQAILRHSNVAVTQACYIKTLPRQTVRAMESLDELICAWPVLISTGKTGPTVQ
jgi:integrase